MYTWVYKRVILAPMYTPSLVDSPIANPLAGLKNSKITYACPTDGGKSASGKIIVL